jgi:hypothetical protein
LLPTYGCIYWCWSSVICFCSCAIIAGLQLRASQKLQKRMVYEKHQAHWEMWLLNRSPTYRAKHIAPYTHCIKINHTSNLAMSIPVNSF